jgi:gluconokinase
MVIVLMGPSGSGKTTIGAKLAAALAWRFVDADDFHPPANREKLALGIPLDDADRWPWLTALRREILALLDAGTDAVIACSALKESYRRILHADDSVVLVELDVPPSVLAERLAHRAGHFASPTLLPSQLSTLEPPTDTLTVDASGTPDEVVAEIRASLGL